MCDVIISVHTGGDECEERTHGSVVVRDHLHPHAGQSGEGVHYHQRNRRHSRHCHLRVKENKLFVQVAKLVEKKCKHLAGILGDEAFI